MTDLSPLAETSPQQVHSRGALLAEGGSDAGIRMQRRRGAWDNVRPGTYVDHLAARALTRKQRHRLLIDALAPRLVSTTVVSHVSAAVLLDLPLWNIHLDRVHVSRPIFSGATRTTGLHVHATGYDDLRPTVVDGVAVTSPARTVVDVARSVPFEQAVVVADAALHAGLVTPDELVSEVQLVRRRQGAARARAVIAFADGQSESVGESRSRVLFARVGLPAMELQYEIRTERGILVARTDFAIPSLRIAGEFDGKVKYGRLLGPGQQPGDVVFEEKLREDAVRECQWDVVRWIWSELTVPGKIAGRWQQAMRRRTAG